MKHLAYILGLVTLMSACSDDKAKEEEAKPEAKTEEKEQPEESGGSCEYVDMSGKINTLEYYEESGIIKGRFSTADPEQSKALESSHTESTVLYYAQKGDKTQPGSGIRATMTVMVSGSCQPYPYHFKAGDGSMRLLVNTDSLNNSTTDLKDEYK